MHALRQSRLKLTAQMSTLLVYTARTIVVEGKMPKPSQGPIFHSKKKEKEKKVRLPPPAKKKKKKVCGRKEMARLVVQLSLITPEANTV